MSSDWWRGAALYQIYPRSFADANGDGVGDLPGVTAKLPYVAALGVDGIWLSPFFTSPMRDFGYDVADHLGVDPLFGTGADFDALLSEAHRLGLKVVIDQVWSHTAAEHPWFQESRASRDNPKADWYVWADARADGSPPNNWQSWMGGPAWTWDPRRKQYHLHNFLPQMPDLNFHCPAVQDAVLEIARHWLDRGVDGFRLDTANLYFHSRGLQDNPPLPEGRRGDSPVLMQRHLHNADQPEAPAFFERLRALMDGCGGGGRSRMAVAEIGGAEPMATMVAYTQGRQRLHTAYSFAFLGERPGAAQVLRHLAPWTEGAALEAWPSWAFSNHDAPRVASRWGGGASGAFAFGGRAAAGPTAAGATPVTWLALLLALRGTVFLYQGEELGLPQGTLAYEDLRDPFGLANWPLNPGRDGCRTPFPWQADAPHLGFSRAARTWLPVDAAHAALAVDRQEADPASTLHATRRLLALRRAHPALRLGDLQALVAEGDVLMLRRQHAAGGGHDALLLAFNLGSTPATVPLPEAVATAAAPLFAHGGAALQGTQLQLPAGAVLFIPLRRATVLSCPRTVPDAMNTPPVPMNDTSLWPDLDSPFALQPAQIEAFRRDGCIKLKQVLSPATLAYFGREITRLTIEFNTQSKPLEERSTYDRAFLQVMNLWEQSALVARFVMGQRLARIAAELLQVRGVRLYHDQSLYKEPGGGITPAHADQYYWPLASDRTITAWIPLQAVPAEMGPLGFYAGSQGVAFGRDLGISDESEEKITENMARHGFHFEVGPFELGEVSFHLGWTFHKAGPNVSDRPRSVMTVIYMDADMRLVPALNAIQANDRDQWCPGAREGEVIATRKNPVVWAR